MRFYYFLMVSTSFYLPLLTYLSTAVGLLPLHPKMGPQLLFFAMANSMQHPKFFHSCKCCKFWLKWSILCSEGFYVWGNGIWAPPKTVFLKLCNSCRYGECLQGPSCALQHFFCWVMVFEHHQHPIPNFFFMAV